MAKRSTTPAAAPLRSALPKPVVTYDDPEWRLIDDCCYGALDGSVITAKRGLRSNLARIPRLFWAIIASHEFLLIVPIMHDVIDRW
jgi:hypothetical protein